MKTKKTKTKVVPLRKGWAPVAGEGKKEWELRAYLGDCSVKTLRLRVAESNRTVTRYGSFQEHVEPCWNLSITLVVGERGEVELTRTMVRRDVLDLSGAMEHCEIVAWEWFHDAVGQVMRQVVKK